MCEDSRMDQTDEMDEIEDFAAAYLRCDATLMLAPGPFCVAEPGTLAAYPAVEVAAGIARVRGVRGVSRRPPAIPPGAERQPGDERAAWDERRWRWSEGDRVIIIGFGVHPDAGASDGEAIWAGSPLTARCHYADVARVALALTLRFPAMRLHLADGRFCSPSDFITSVALPRLAPALASADLAIRERAEATQALYADLLASVPPPADAATTEAAFAAAPFSVLAEDERLLAVSKPAGVVTHPTYKHPAGTLTDAVFAWQAARGLARPWLLHRLDRETSGVVLFAKRDEARRSIASQFERHTAHKRYLALIVWPPTLTAEIGAEQEIDAPLARDPLDRRRVVVAADGQPARTRFRLLAVAAGYALAQAEPVTGRTHQIRAHLASVGAPLVGDATYLPADSPARDLAPRAMLHAWRLDLRYPGGEALWSVVAPPPADFVATAEALGLGAALHAALATVESEAVG
jgi:23S rRNA pseudouridine1911/1915/1917 synthase